MASVFAIVSKKVFEKGCVGAEVGTLWATDAYLSKHRGLSPLAEGGSLFLVTVRPPHERLWLVAVLEAPKMAGDRWQATANRAPIVDITALRSKIKFESGKGMSDKPGALGMSLQTPRALSAADVTLLRSTLGDSGAPAEADEAPPKEPQGPIVYNDDVQKYLRPRHVRDLRSLPPQKKLWSEWRKRSRDYEGVRVPDEGPLRDRVREVGELMSGRGEPPELDLEMCSVALAMGGETSANKQLAYLAVREGVAFALDVLIEAHRYKRVWYPSTLELPADPQDATPIVQEALAEALLRADALVRDAAQERARAVWKDAPRALRAGLLACFPQRADWAEELARSWPEIGKEGPAYLLHSTLANRDLLTPIIAASGFAGNIANVVPNLGLDAVPLLRDLLDQDQHPNEQRSLARALACIGTAEVAETFVRHLRKKHVRPFAIEFFARFDHLAEDALGPLAKRRTQIGRTAKDILQRLSSTRSRTQAPIPEADEEDVPEILRNPPWREGKRPKPPKVPVLELSVPDEPKRLYWSELARRRFVAGRFGKVGWQQSEEQTAELVQKTAAGEKSYLYANFPAGVALPLFEQRPNNMHIWNDVPVFMLALHGERALEGALRAFQRGLHAELEVLLWIESPRLAAAIARHRLSNSYGWGMLTWAEKFPETAALGFIPEALGEDRDGQKGGTLGLRFLVSIGHEDLVRSTAERHGTEAAAAINILLSWDTRYDCPKKPPKMPPSYRPVELRPPRLRSGKALPGWAVERLGEMLRFSPAAPPYVGIAQVREACEPRSLAEHAWDIAQAWDLGGAKEGHIWMLRAVRHLGDDEVVRRLTPALKGEGIARMLGDIGTDAALMELGTIQLRIATRKTRRAPKYAWGTDGAIALIAAQRGLSVDTVEEQFIPTCEVDGDGGIDIDLGKRSFRVGFDHRLSPTLHDDAGEPVRALPRGRADDDPDKLAAAHSLWTDLQEDVDVIAHRRMASLENAMVDRRRWLVSEFHRVWIDHPLMVHMARAVVFEAVDGEGLSLLSFRVAEDGSFADRYDEHRPPPDATVAVGVAHPARWTSEEREQWRETFADYELLQPFPQLSRQPVLLDGSKLEATVLATECKMDLEQFEEALAGTGWVGGRSRSWARAFPDLFGVIHLEDGQLTVRAARDGLPVRFADVSADTLCELYRVLQVAGGGVTVPHYSESGSLL